MTLRDTAKSLLGQNVARNGEPACFRLLRLLYAAQGVELPAIDEIQRDAEGRPYVTDGALTAYGGLFSSVKPVEARTGDVAVVYKGQDARHVGVVVGDRVCHASRSAGVTLPKLAAFRRRGTVRFVRYRGRDAGRLR